MAATPSVPTDQDLNAWFQVRDMLGTAQHVDSIETHDDQNPPLIDVEFTTTHVPPSVHDLLDLYDARILNPRVTDDGTLAVDITVRSAFECKGSNAIRERGGSSMIAIPPSAMQCAGFHVDDKLFVDARENELRLVRDTPDDDHDMLETV